MTLERAARLAVAGLFASVLVAMVAAGLACLAVMVLGRAELPGRPKRPAGTGTFPLSG